MTLAHIAIESLFALLLVGAVVSIARDLKRDWLLFIDPLGDY